MRLVRKKICSIWTWHEEETNDQRCTSNDIDFGTIFFFKKIAPKFLD